MSTGLFFERVHIRRVPGVEDGGFTLDGLVPGVNVVHGPNASGKSTTARAIELLLWPRLGRAERPWLEARFRLDGAAWSVDVDTDRVSYQREGNPSAAPLLPPAEEHDRYRLSLHELIRTDDVRFARAIVTESAGGYDVPLAGAVLSPRTTASQCRTERDELRQAREELNAAVEKQETLRNAERRLGGLRGRKREAVDAAQRLGVLEVALEYANRREELQAVRAGLEAFPEGMSRLHGDEFARLQRIAERLRQIDDAARGAQENRDSAQRAIVAATLPDAGVEPELISALRADLEELRAADNQIQTAQQERDRAAVRLAEERVRVAPAVDEARLAELDSLAMDELADFADRAARAHSTAAALDGELAAIGEIEAAPGTGRLDRGVHLLQQWLRSGEPVRAVPRARVLLAAAAGIAAGLGVGLGRLDPPFFLLALLGALAVILLYLRGASQTADPRDVPRREFERLGLGAPATWQAPEVEQLLDELLDRQVAERARAERVQRRVQVTEQRRLHDTVLAEIAAERRVITERFGVAPGTDEGQLHWLATRISRWQDARSELSAAEAALSAARSGADSLRAGLIDRLALFGFDAVRTNGDLSGAIDGLDRRRHAREAARIQLANATTDLNRLFGEHREQEDVRCEIFAGLALPEDAADTVRDWCGEFAGYQQQVAALQAAEIAVASARRRLEGMAAENVLFEVSPGELESRRLELHERAAALDALGKEITEIETRITDAKKAHDIEAALERVERCEHRLREARERDTRAVIGNALIEFVQRSTRDEHLPAVFHCAREIFSRITHGRYELRFAAGEEPVFRAWDNHAGRGRALDELSTGTRIQLLLAVRIAFVEQQEQGTHLPLVLDEVLGNSDDERAWAIMEAAVELARNGRQVFYFTAQADEVQKWEAVLDRYPEVARRVIDLRETRTIQKRVDIPVLKVAAFPYSHIPDPGETDHHAYGRILGVPALDPVTAQPNEVHLWYLVEDPRALHRLLCLGPYSWGMLEGFVTKGGRRLVDGELFLRLEILARAATSYLRESKVGRGRPVDRLTLVDAPAISSAFLDRVEELRQKVGGDARRLVGALENREIPRFHREKADELREYLEEQGYLDHAEPLSEEVIRLRVLATVAAEVEGGLVSVTEVDRLIARMKLDMTPLATAKSIDA